MAIYFLFKSSKENSWKKILKALLRNTYDKTLLNLSNWYFFKQRTNEMNKQINHACQYRHTVLVTYCFEEMTSIGPSAIFYQVTCLKCFLCSINTFIVITAKFNIIINVRFLSQNHLLYFQIICSRVKS